MATEPGPSMAPLDNGPHDASAGRSVSIAGAGTGWRCDAPMATTILTAGRVGVDDISARRPRRAAERVPRLGCRPVLIAHGTRAQRLAAHDGGGARRQALQTGSVRPGA